MLDLQLSFYRPLYTSGAHCPLLQFLRYTRFILAGAQTYFVVPLFKWERKISFHDLVPNPRMYNIYIYVCMCVWWNFWDAGRVIYRGRNEQWKVGVGILSMIDVLYWLLLAHHRSLGRYFSEKCGRLQTDEVPKRTEHEHLLSRTL